MNPPGADPDGTVDLSSAPVDAREQHAASTLRTALDPAPLSETHLQHLVDVSVLSAARRRRHRRIGVPAVVLTSAAACAAIIVGVATMFPVSGDAPVSSDAPSTGSGSTERTAFLSSLDVQAVIPSAEATLTRGPFRPNPPDRPLLDACQSAELEDTAVPQTVAYGLWSASADATEGGADDADPRATALTATVATYASPDQAIAYAQALNNSTSTCSTADAAWQPVGMATLENVDASALYTQGYHDGRWYITATVVRGQVAATTSAGVPVARDGYEQAALDVIALADLAAKRAEAS